MKDLKISIIICILFIPFGYIKISSDAGKEPQAETKNVDEKFPKLKTIAFLTDEKEKYLYPRWSLDGKYIALAGLNYRGLWIFNVENKSILPVIGKNENVFGFKWTYKNEIFIPVDENSAITVHPMSDNANPDYSNVIVSFKDGTVIQKEDGIYFKSSDEKLYLISVAGRNPVIENDKIIYQIGENSENKFVQYDGMKKTGLQKDKETGKFQIMYMAAFSPDGRYMLYPKYEVSGNAITKSELFIYDLKTLKQNQLTNTPDIYEIQPDWSFDGKKIACVDARTFIIYLIELE